MKDKKRMFLFLFFVLTVVMIVAAGCTGGKESLSPPISQDGSQETLPVSLPDVREDEVLNAPPLCKAEEQIALEFETIDTAFTMIARHSIFREKADDPKYLSRKMLERTFQFLSKPIPPWAEELVETQISSDEFKPSSVASAVYLHLVQDPEYQDLIGVSGKNLYIKASINALIKAIEDPFAYYYSPEEWISSGKQERNSGSYRGMGITLSKNERGEMVIGSVFSGSPAEEAGLAIGDTILLFNGSRVDFCSVSQFVLAIKKLQDPEVSLVVRKRGEEQPQRMLMSLGRVHLVELSTCPSFELPEGRGETIKGLGYVCPLLDREQNSRPDVLYINLKSFSPQIARDLRTILSSTDFTQVEGVIVDLRKNPGGLLSAVSDILDYFLVEEDVIYREDRASWHMFQERTVIISSSYRQNKYDLVPSDIPVVVLVGRDTYSAAELFAGAMQDHKRAVIISKDDRTGGKGTVNLYIELAKGGKVSQGALYIAIGLWKTPNGNNIELQDLDKDGYEEVGGLAPDIRVEFTDEDYTRVEAEPSWYDPVMFAAFDLIDSQK